MTIAEILETMINYYEAAFDPGFDEGGGLDEPDTIRKSNRRAAKATWQTLAEEDTDNESYRLPLGKAFWPLSAEERREIQRLFRSEEMRGLVTGVGGTTTQTLRWPMRPIGGRDAVRLAVCAMPSSSGLARNPIPASIVWWISRRR